MKYLKPMHAFATILLLLTALFSLTACIEEKEASTDSLYLLPWPNEEGEYHLEEVEITTLEDNKAISGKAAKMFVHPYVENEKLSGKAPKARLARMDNLFIPQDTISQELLAVYAHTERLMELDEALGLKEKLDWPRRIGVQTLGADQNGKQRINNAGYSESIDGTLYYPFSSQKKLALSLNAGVIAHEHFHALFSKIVREPIRKKYNLRFPIGEPASLKAGYEEENLIKDKRNFFLIRTFNEAFADLWGYIYSQDKRLIVRSLHNNNSFARNYDLQRIARKPLKKTEPNIDLQTNFTDVLGRAYRLAGQIANTMISKIDEDIAKLKVADSKRKKVLQAEILINMLLKLRQVIDAKIDEGLEAEDVLLAIYSGRLLTSEDCQKISNLAYQDHILNKKCQSNEESPFDLKKYLSELTLKDDK